MSKYLDFSGLSHFLDKIKALFKTVAFTGSYNDLADKPEIPSQYPRITYIAARSSSDSVAQNTADWGLSESAPTKVHFYSGKGIHTATNRSTDKQTITVYHGVAPDEIAGDGITVNNYIMSVPEYEGATAVANGTSGLVPPALIAEKDKLLTGSGDWISVADALGYAPANDANVVHTSGNETIAGTKTFNTTIFGAINSTVALSSQIKSNETHRDIGQVTDSDGSRVGLIRASKAADGTRNITVTAVKSDNTIAGSIAVQTDADGNTYATAPNTLATRTGGSDIITRGYLNSADSGVVHTSGNETIGGSKTFTNTLNITHETDPAILNLKHAAGQYDDIRFLNENNDTIGIIRKNASNASLQIGFRCANGTSWQQGPRITLAAGGAWSLLSNDATNAYILSCSATGNLTFNGPEPAASSDNTKLATTQWVRDATGDFACNAATAYALSTPRTISVEGKEYVGSASFDGSGNVSLNVMPCFATSYSGSSRTLPYHLLASCTITGNSLTRSIVFLVTRTHTDLSGCGDGIFSLTLRANAAGKTGAIRAKWLCRTSDLDENAIQIGYNLVSGNVYADVFVYDKATYMTTTFRVLSQSTAYNGIGSSSFTLTDAMQTSASATTGGCYATLDDAAQALRGVGSGNSYPGTISPG